MHSESEVAGVKGGGSLFPLKPHRAPSMSLPLFFSVESPGFSPPPGLSLGMKFLPSGVCSFPSPLGQTLASATSSRKPAQILPTSLPLLTLAAALANAQQTIHEIGSG